MRTGVEKERPDAPEGEIEYFGFKLTVRSPRLAALLNSDDDDVRVVGTGGAEAIALEAAEPAVLQAPAHRGAGLDDVSVMCLRPARDDV